MDATQVEELLRQANGLPHGDSKIMLLEEAVRLADSPGVQSEALRFKAREELVEAATFGGAPDKALVAYSWCLAQMDKKTTGGDDFSFISSRWQTLWKYKWIMTEICGFPQISRAQIYEMLDDMERRFREEFDSTRAVLKLRSQIERFWGNDVDAVLYYYEWLYSPRDLLSDCKACDLDDEVNFQIYTGDDEQAVRTAEPLLAGQSRCSTVPQRTYAQVLLPLLRLGRLEEAARYHQKGYRMVSKNKDYLDSIYDHLVFLVLTENLDRAVRLFEKHLPWALDIANLSHRFTFHCGGLLLFEQLRAHGRERVSLRLPQNFPLFVEDGKYAVEAIAAWLDGSLRELAARFNARNGNDYFTRRIAETTELKDLTTPYPLTGHQE